MSKRLIQDFAPLLLIALLGMAFVTGVTAVNYRNHRNQVRAEQGMHSCFDDLPLYPGSWHKAHVVATDSYIFMLDSGKTCAVMFPALERQFIVGEKGTLYLKVLENDPQHPVIESYEFEKFVPDSH